MDSPTSFAAATTSRLPPVASTPRSVQRPLVPRSPTKVDNSTTNVLVVEAARHPHFWHMLGGLIVLVLAIMAALAWSYAIKLSVKNASNKLSIFDRSVLWPYVYAIVLTLILIIIAWFLARSF